MTVHVLSCSIVCGLWNGGGSRRSSFSSLCLSLLLVGGVRGSARAALRARTLSPNTIVLCLLCSFLFSPLPAFLRAPLFLLLWNGGG